MSPKMEVLYRFFDQHQQQTLTPTLQPDLSKSGETSALSTPTPKINTSLFFETQTIVLPVKVGQVCYAYVRAVKALWSLFSGHSAGRR